MIVTELENEVRKYISYLSTVKRYSHHTLSSYQVDLQQLCAYLFEKKIVAVTDIFNRDLQLWIRFLNDRGASPRSIQRKISTVRGLLRHYKSNHPDFKNPATQLNLPKPEQKLPTYLSSHELKKASDSGPFESFSSFKTYITFALLSGCGLRRSEIINLRIGDVDLGKQTLKIKGKGNKTRIVPIENGLSEELKHYIEELKKQVNNPQWIIVTERGKQSYPKLIERHVNTYLTKQYPHLKHTNPHMLRHSFATGLLQNGAGINDIKELLGHASLASTQIYTQTNVEQLKNIHKFHHPKNKKR